MTMPMSLLQRFAQSNHDPVIQGLLARFGQSGPPPQLDPMGGGGSYGAPQMQPAPAQAPPMAPPQAPMFQMPVQAQQPGLLDRIFGGGEQVPGAGRAGLLDAGIAMLANSRASRVGEFAPSVGQALAAGLDAGRSSYHQAGQRATWEHLNSVIGDPSSTPAQRRAAIFRALPFAPGQQADVLNRMLEQDVPGRPTVVPAGGSVLQPDGSFRTAPGRDPANRTAITDTGGRRLLVDMDSGEPIRDLGPTPVPDAQARPRTQITEVDGHRYLVNMDTGVRISDLGPAGGPGSGAKPTTQQQSSAELGTSALSSWRTIEQLRTQNPGIEAEVGRMLTTPKFVRAMPLFHNAGDAATAAAAAGASPAAQQYLRAKWGFMDNIIRTRIPGGRMSAALFTQYASEFMPGLDTEANAQMRGNEIQALLTAQGQAGYDVNPEWWNRAAKRHGVDTIDLSSVLQGGSGDSRLDTIRQRYPAARP